MLKYIHQGDIMNFVSREHLNIFLNNLLFLGQGSQGACYLNKRTNMVIKIFNDYFDNEIAGYSDEFLMRFSFIKNDSFVWPSDVIKIGNEVVGYTMPYKKAKNLYKINPLFVNLNTFDRAAQRVMNDVKVLSDNSIGLYDVIYNILYANGKFYVIDTLEYSKRKTSYEENKKSIDDELKLFLVDNYFNDFVRTDTILNEMYNNNDISALDFLRAFRIKLSEYIGKDIEKLNDAKILVKKSTKSKYMRDF